MHSEAFLSYLSHHRLPKMLILGCFIYFSLIRPKTESIRHFRLKRANIFSQKCVFVLQILALRIIAYYFIIGIIKFILRHEKVHKIFRNVHSFDCLSRKLDRELLDLFQNIDFFLVFGELVPL